MADLDIQIDLGEPAIPSKAFVRRGDGTFEFDNTSRPARVVLKNITVKEDWIPLLRAVAAERESGNFEACSQTFDGQRVALESLTLGAKLLVENLVDRTTSEELDLGKDAE